jgi:hypothetical protein
MAVDVAARVARKSIQQHSEDALRTPPAPLDKYLGTAEQ